MSLRKGLIDRLSPRQRVIAFKLRHGEYRPQRWVTRRLHLVAPDRVRGVPIADLSQLMSPTATQDALCAALEAHDVEWRRLPAGVSSVPRIAVAAEHYRRVGRAIATLPNPSSWAVRVWRQRRSRWRSAQRAALIIDESAVELFVRRVYRSPRGEDTEFPGVGGTVIEFWDRLEGGEERADGDPHVEGTRVPRSRSPVVPYLVPEHWEALGTDEAPDVPALALPSLFAALEPVDVVYTWVDGSDPEWQRRKRVALGSEYEDVNSTADADSRFVHHDELRYSLRSLEAYAPWVRHVYLVVDRQRPEWLVLDHPRLTVVDHADIFADPSVLPVFNSHAIESQLHHISGLSDRYLYMNDDVFFGRTVSKELFFGANGISRFFLSRALLDVGPVAARDLPVLSAAKHNAALISDVFGRAISQKFMHTPHPQSRTVLEEMEERFPQVFADVAKSKIRHPNDYSIASALHHYYAFATARAVQGSINYGYINLSDDDAELMLLRLLRGRRRDVFCLNDTFADAHDQRRVDELSSWFLERYFPVPSTFEKSAT